METTEIKAMSVKDVAEALGRGETTVYGLIKTGKLKARKLGHSTIILPEDVKELLNNLPIMGTEEVAPVRTPDRRRKQVA